MFREVKSQAFIVLDVDDKTRPDYSAYNNYRALLYENILYKKPHLPPKNKNREEQATGRVIIYHKMMS